MADLKIRCPRAVRDTSPCAARDGTRSCTTAGACVGCGQHAGDLLRDLARRYCELKEAHRPTSVAAQVKRAAREIWEMLP